MAYYIPRTAMQSVTGGINTGSRNVIDDPNRPPWMKDPFLTQFQSLYNQPPASVTTKVAPTIQGPTSALSPAVAATKQASYGPQPPVINMAPQQIHYPSVQTPEELGPMPRGRDRATMEAWRAQAIALGLDPDDPLVQAGNVPVNRNNDRTRETTETPTTPITPPPPPPPTNVDVTMPGWAQTTRSSDQIAGYLDRLWGRYNTASPVTADRGDSGGYLGDARNILTGEDAELTNYLNRLSGYAGTAAGAGANLGNVSYGEDLTNLRSSLYGLMGDQAGQNVGIPSEASGLTSTASTALNNMLGMGYEGISEELFGNLYSSAMRPHQDEMERQMRMLQESAQSRGVYHSGYLTSDQDWLVNRLAQVSGDISSNLALESQRMGLERFGQGITGARDISELMGRQARDVGAEEIARARMGGEFLSAREMARLAEEDENRRREELRLSGADVAGRLEGTAAGLELERGRGVTDIANIARMGETSDAYLGADEQRRIDDLLRSAVGAETDYHQWETGTITDEYQREWDRKFKETLAGYDIDYRLNDQDLRAVEMILSALRITPEQGADVLARMIADGIRNFTYQEMQPYIQRFL